MKYEIKAELDSRLGDKSLLVRENTNIWTNCEPCWLLFKFTKSYEDADDGKVLEYWSPGARILRGPRTPSRRK